MKKISTVLLTLGAALALMFASCNKKAPEVPVNHPPLQIESGELTLKEGETRKLKIMSGGGEYYIQSAVESIVRTSVEGNRITLEAGEVEDEDVQVTVTVSDRYGQELNLNVMVLTSVLSLELDTEETSLTVGVRDWDEVTVSILQGNGGYEVTVVEGADLVEILGLDEIDTANRFTIKAVAAGTAIVKVTDAEGKIWQINVAISPTVALEVSDSELNFTALQHRKTIGITGNGEYLIANSSPSVIRVSLEGSSIAVTSMSKGTATITVMDVLTEVSVNIPVEVDYDGRYALDLMEISGSEPHYYCYADYRLLPADKRIQQTMTWEIMFRPQSFANNGMVMGLESNFVIKYHNAAGALKLAGIAGDFVLQTGAVLTANKWTHLAVVYDNSKTDMAKYTLYIDGVPQTLTDARRVAELTHDGIDLTAGHPTSSNTYYGVQIGRAAATTNAAIRGAVAEARVWTVARTAEQITANMNELTETAPEGLLSHWDFNVGEQTDYIIDRSGSPYDCDLVISNFSTSGNFPAAVEASTGRFIDLTGAQLPVPPIEP